MHRSAICSHCSRVGSMPVGLCAQPAHQMTVLRCADNADLSLHCFGCLRLKQIFASICTTCRRHLASCAPRPQTRAAGMKHDPCRRCACAKGWPHAHAGLAQLAIMQTCPIPWHWQVKIAQMRATTLQGAPRRQWVSPHRQGDPAKVVVWRHTRPHWNPLKPLYSPRSGT